MTFTGCRR